MNDSNGWLRAHIQSLERRMESRFDAVDAKLDDYAERMVRLEERTKLRASMWGVLGGALPAAGVLIYILLKVLP